MKRILCTGLLIVSALTMTGCEDIPGVLSVTKNFNVLVKGKKKTVPVGEHKTSLDFKKKRVVATIKTGDDSLKVELSVPEGEKIPSNGNFELKSAQTGQPFDVLGSVQTKVTESERQTGYESCQFRDHQTVCNPKGCHVVPIIRQGSRHIEFFYRETDQAMQLDMTSVEDVNESFANFEGRANYREKLITYEGTCF